jgi:hypothetical protein
MIVDAFNHGLCEVCFVYSVDVLCFLTVQDYNSVISVRCYNKKIHRKAMLLLLLLLLFLLILSLFLKEMLSTYCGVEIKAHMLECDKLFMHTRL